MGLVITEPLNYSFSDPAALDFVAGLAESCEEAGQGLLLVAVGPNRSVADGSAAVLAAGVDGFVVYSASDDDPYLAVVLQRHLPVVVVDQPKDVPGASRVVHRRPRRDAQPRRTCCGAWSSRDRPADHAAGPRLAPRWSRPAVADPERVQTPHFHVQSERIRGVYDAMSAAGLDPESLTVVESYEHLTDVGRCTAPRSHWTPNPRITALMCTADVLALSAMDYLRARGIYVPGQMTVTGFDGVPDALQRGLTTVVQPSVEKGRRAGELLHNPPRSGLPVIDVLDTEVVRGRTSGPPA